MRSAYTSRRTCTKRETRWAVTGLICLTAIATAISATEADKQKTETAGGSVRILVLGTAQDGGLPHTACDGDHCLRARRDPSFARRVASLAILAPPDDVYLVDASPDITDQLAAVEQFVSADSRPRGGVDRSPLSGVLLTHAHIGHYLGLAHLGFEAVNTRDLPVYATPRMTSFLEKNGPWSQLVTKQNIRLAPVQPGETFELAPSVRVTPIAVPHRDEYADTVAFRIEGPERTLLYMPDTEPWHRWEERFLALLEGVDIALLDATFYSSDELPGRPVESIGHPLVRDTIERLGPRVRSNQLDVRLTHMNHSNPLVDPESEASRAVDGAGFQVLRDGQVIQLGTLSPSSDAQPTP